MDNLTNLGYRRFEFVETRQELAIPCIILITLASIIGTFGNFLILAVLVKFSSMRSRESIFIGNLAISDTYVTLIADPMSVLAKIEGEDFFVKYPGLCRTIGAMCTISCVCSLLTIGGMAVNRYFHICNYRIYRSLFTRRNVILMCCSFYVVGILLVLMNLAGVGDHTFDRKSLECIFDRMASRPFTVVFSVVMVWIPLCAISFSYIRIYLYVMESRRRIHMTNASTVFVVKDSSQKDDKRPTMKDRDKQRGLKLAKTLFFIYAVFAACWLPYALLIVIDSRDEFSHELHLLITTTAHLHPSLSCIVYYLTNQKFRRAFVQLFNRCCNARSRSRGSRSLTSNGKSDNSGS